MALTYEFMIARAEEAASEADRAMLDNVRRKAERSEAAWRDMAARAQQVQQDRDERELEKARERAAATG
jgi:flagellin-specific chaperone FliS